MKRTSVQHLLPALSLLCCTSVMSATIYKSVDANGVVTYSDTRPREDVLVETLVIEEREPPQGETAQQQLQEMRETTDRMVADRMARERHRAELRQLDREPAAEDTTPELAEYYTNPVVDTGYPVFPGWRPWHRPRPPYPEHPGTRPPLLPLDPPNTAGTRPPPSSDYPASLVRRHYNPKVRASLD